jgi:hypothetical protein
MKRQHRPTKYNVITASGVTYGWRCAHPRCGIPSKRYADEGARDRTLAQHKADFKATK